MNKIPIHYLPSLLRRIFNIHENVVKLLPYSLHQTAGGWTGVLKCGISGQEYRIEITPIKSEIEVVTVDSLLEKGGLN